MTVMTGRRGKFQHVSTVKSLMPFNAKERETQPNRTNHNQPQPKTFCESGLPLTHSLKNFPFAVPPGLWGDAWTAWLRGLAEAESDQCFFLKLINSLFQQKPTILYATYTINMNMYYIDIQWGEYMHRGYHRIYMHIVLCGNTLLSNNIWLQYMYIQYELLYVLLL